MRGQDAVGDGEAETLVARAGREERLDEDAPLGFGRESASRVRDDDFHMRAGSRLAVELAAVVRVEIDRPGRQADRTAGGERFAGVVEQRAEDLVQALGIDADGGQVGREVEAEGQPLRLRGELSGLLLREELGEVATACSR